MIEKTIWRARREGTGKLIGIKSYNEKIRSIVVFDDE